METAIEKLKAKIKKKFKTYSHFAKVAKLDRYEFQKYFLAKTDLEMVDQKYLKKIMAGLDNRSADDKISEMKKNIEAEGGVYFFCKNNPQFNNITVAEIMTGKIKTVSPVVQDLLNHFKIK